MLCKDFIALADVPKSDSLLLRKRFVLQKVWAHFDPARTGAIGLHQWRKFLAALKAARSPLATKAHYVAWEQHICYEAWHSHTDNKGLLFADALLILLHDKFGRHVSTCFPCQIKAGQIKIFKIFSLECCELAQQ